MKSIKHVIEYTDSPIRDREEDWGQGSVAGCLSIMCEAFGSILSTMKGGKVTKGIFNEISKHIEVYEKILITSKLPKFQLRKIGSHIYCQAVKSQMQEENLRNSNRKASHCIHKILD